MITPYVPDPAEPLTDWQRRERFATMRNAQRQARALRGEANFMRCYPRAYGCPEEIRQVDDEAAMWEDLARWLGKSVRPT